MFFGGQQMIVRKRLLTIVLPLLLIGAPSQTPAQKAVIASEMQFENARFLVVDVDLQRAKLELHWRNPAGNPFLNFRALEDYLKANGQRPVALMNAGIFETNSRPLGLHIERGQICDGSIRGDPATEIFICNPTACFFSRNPKPRLV
jgi:uncharacterized protein YigE (DUF2233 family)